MTGEVPAAVREFATSAFRSDTLERSFPLQSTTHHNESPPRLAAALIGRLKRYRPAVLALVLLGSATASRADMYIRVTEDPNSVNPLTQTFTFTGDGQQPTLSSSDFGGGTGTFGDFTIQTISATSNSATGGPQAILTANISVTANAAEHVLMVEVTDDNFSFPPGGSYLLSSSASDTNVLTGTSDTHSFLSFAAQGHTPFGTDFPAPPIAYSLGNNANGQSTTYRGFSLTQPYSLTNVTIFDSVTGGGGILNTTGSTVVAVPEPSTAILMGLGFGVVGLASLRRRARAS
jgi:hypothetical protein